MGNKTRQIAKKAKPIQAKQSIEDVFRQVLWADLDRVNEWVPVAQKGKDIEGVHQMRVGLRRMRSALTLFRPAIPRRITRKLAGEMRWSALQLDRARDLDVYIADNLSREAAGHDKGKKRLRKVAIKRKREVYKQVRAFIRGKRFRAFNQRLRHWLKTRGWRRGLSKKERKALYCNITPFAAWVLEEHRSRVLKAGEKIRKMDDETLHDLRIDCKKLRYASEFFAPLYADSMSPFTRSLKQLQDVLGLLHDCMVMEGLQNDLLQGKQAKRLEKIAGRLMEQRKKSALDLKQVLFQSWDNFAGTKPPWLAGLF